MLNIFSSFSTLIHSVVVLFSIDYQNFRSFFPTWYPIAYTLLRILPLFAALLVLVKLAVYIWSKVFENRSSSILETLKGFVKNLYGSPAAFIIIFAIGIALRFWYAFTLPFIANEGDASARIEHAKYLFDGGSTFTLIWPPAYFYMLNLYRLFTDDILIGSRLITLTLGIFTIPVAYSFIKKAINRDVALLSIALLAINPFHIRYSIVAMSEVPFLFFTFAALLCLFHYIKTEKWYWLLLSTLCINVNNLIRFEGWIIAAFIPLFLLYYHKNLRAFFAYGITNAFGILLYMYHSYKATGVLVYGLASSDVEVKYSYATKADPIQHMLGNLSWDQVYPLWLLPVLLYGMYIGLKRKTVPPLLLLSFGMLSLITYKVATFSSEAFWRYFSTGLFLALPYLAIGLSRLAKARTELKVLLAVIIPLAVSYKIGTNYTFYKNNVTVPAGLMETAVWLKDNKQPGQHYIYNSSGLDFAGFRLLSHTRVTEMYFPHYAGMRKFKEYEDYTQSVFLRELYKPTTAFIVYQNQSETDSFMRMPVVMDSINANRIALQPVYANHEYKVLKVTHP